MKNQRSKRFVWPSALSALVMLALAMAVPCKSATAVLASDSGQSAIQVEIGPKGPVVLTTKAAEFRLLPSGYVQTFLLKDGHKLTLDDPGAGESSAADFLVHAGKPAYFSLDFAHVKVSDAAGKMGSGKRIEIPGEALSSGAKLERVVVLEVYDDFPNLLLSTVEYRNPGNTDFEIDRTVDQRHRFNAHLANAQAQPYEMWSFQGSSYDWGKDDVREAHERFLSTECHGRGRQRWLRWRDSSCLLLDKNGGRSDWPRRDFASVSFSARARSGRSARACQPGTPSQLSSSPETVTPLPAVSSRCTPGISISLCSYGRAFCRKKDGNSRSLPAKPTTSVGADGDTRPM